MSAYHVRLDAMDVESRNDDAARGFAPPDGKESVPQERAPRHPEDSDSDRNVELLIVRAAIRRLSTPASERDAVHRGIIRLLCDPSVLDDAERDVA